MHAFMFTLVFDLNATLDQELTFSEHPYSRPTCMSHMLLSPAPYPHCNTPLTVCQSCFHLHAHAFLGTRVEYDHRYVVVNPFVLQHRVIWFSPRRVGRYYHNITRNLRSDRPSSFRCISNTRENNIRCEFITRQKRIYL